MKSQKLSPTGRMILAARVEQTLAQPLLTVAHPTGLATHKILRSSIGDFSFSYGSDYLEVPYLREKNYLEVPQHKCFSDFLRVPSQNSH